MKFYNLLRAFLGVLNPKTWGPFIEVFNISRFDHAVSVSWSQSGEDLAIVNIFNTIREGKYLDIGAHHPSRFSVTRILYSRGWSGVNIDANQDLLPQFMVSRKRDINLNFAIGIESSYKIAIFDEPALSTVNLQWKDRFLNENQKLIEFRQVAGKRLSEIIYEYFSKEPLDFLNVDIEGADFDALLSLDLDSLPKNLWPKWVLLETSPPISNALETDSVRLLRKFGYEPYLVLLNATLLKIT